MNFIDSHCHLDFPKFHGDLEEVINRTFEAGAAALINVGVNLPTSVSSVQLASRYQSIYAAVGIHPHDAKLLSGTVLEKLKGLSKERRVVAIGEIGLDYYRNLSAQEVQREAFVSQLKLALEMNKPVIIHCRDAYNDVLNILDEHYLPAIGDRRPGVIHSFSSGVRHAQEFLKRGFYIGFNGMTTYSGNDQLMEAVKIVPLDKILIETDAPFLPPQSHRGQRNEPLYVLEVAEQIAQIKGIPLEEVCRATTDNACRLFNLK